MFSKEEKKTIEDQTNTSNIIGKETVLQGDIESSGNIRLEGKVHGNSRCKAKFVMGNEACLEGNVLAGTAEIAGKVKGNIEVSEWLILKPSAVINGDIITNKLILEPGATFNGSCQMGHPAKDIEISTPQSQRSQRKVVKKA